MKFKKTLTMLSIVAAIAAATSVTALAGNDGDISDLEIDGINDLQLLATEINNGNYSGKTFTLTVDIDGSSVENFIPIGTQSKPFKGTFDGQRHKISNLNIYQPNDKQVINVGVFGFVSGGTIQDVTFDNITVKNDNNVSSENGNEIESTTGVAAGSLKKGTIQNVTVSANCTVTGQLRTGGISGDMSDTAAKIVDCTNYAVVTGGDKYTGGITGAIHNISSSSASAKNGTISDCHNYGTVSGTTETGGIVGYSDRGTIERCHNDGTVTGAGNYGIGGILGCDAYNPFRVVIFPVNPTIASTVTDCINNADISGGKNSSCVGGIVGGYVAAPSKEQPSKNQGTNIIRCYNSGNVTGNAAQSGTIYGYPQTYAKGNADANVNHMIVYIEDCILGGSVNGEPAEVYTNTQFETHKLIDAGEVGFTFEKTIADVDDKNLSVTINGIEKKAPVNGLPTMTGDGDLSLGLIIKNIPAVYKDAVTAAFVD